jgi:hypothetical protein
MAEHTPADTSPAEYRGGVPEPEDAKDGAAELARGLVPEDVKGGQAPDSDQPEELGNDVLGDLDSGDGERSVEVDLTAGDNADATSHGGSSGAHGSEAGLGRHGDESIDEKS